MSIGGCNIVEFLRYLLEQFAKMYRLLGVFVVYYFCRGKKYAPLDDTFCVTKLMPVLHITEQKLQCRFVIMATISTNLQLRQTCLTQCLAVFCCG